MHYISYTWGPLYKDEPNSVIYTIWRVTPLLDPVLNYAVIGSDTEVTSFDWNSPRSGCRRPLSQVLGMFEPLQVCNSQGVALTIQEMMSRDLR